MKKGIALLLVLLFAMSFATGALAASTEYRATEQFIECLVNRGVKYSYDGMTDNDKEHMHVVYNGDYMDSIRIDIFFDSDNAHASLRCWDLIHYSDADFAKVLRVCNKVNNDYKYTTFFADESDNTVSVKMDLVLLEEMDCSEIIRESMIRMVNIADDNYEAFTPYDA